MPSPGSKRSASSDAASSESSKKTRKNGVAKIHRRVTVGLKVEKEIVENVTSTTTTSSDKVVSGEKMDVSDSAGSLNAGTNVEKETDIYEDDVDISASDVDSDAGSDIPTSDVGSDDATLMDDDEDTTLVDQQDGDKTCLVAPKTSNEHNEYTYDDAVARFRNQIRALNEELACCQSAMRIYALEMRNLDVAKADLNPEQVCSTLQQIFKETREQWVEMFGRGSLWGWSNADLIRGMITKIRGLLAESEKAASKHAEKVKELKGENANVVAVIQQTKAQVTKLEQRNQTLQEEMTGLRKYIDGLRQRQSAQLQRNNKLVAELDESNQEVKAWKLNFEDALRDLESLENIKVSLAEEVKWYKDVAATQKSEINGLTSSMDILQDQLQASREELEDRASAHQLDLQVLEMNHESELKAVKAEVEERDIQVSALQVNLHQQKEFFESELESRDKKIAELEAQLQKQSADHSASHSDMQSRLQHSQAEASKVLGKYADSFEQNARLTSTIYALNKEIEQLKDIEKRCLKEHNEAICLKKAELKKLEHLAGTSGVEVSVLVQHIEKMCAEFAATEQANKDIIRKLEFELREKICHDAEVAKDMVKDSLKVAAKLEEMRKKGELAGVRTSSVQLNKVVKGRVTKAKGKKWGCSVM